jgi:hypothetical protein
MRKPTTGSSRSTRSQVIVLSGFFSSRKITVAIKIPYAQSRLNEYSLIKFSDFSKIRRGASFQNSP